jgi:hypothetical protein
LRCLKRLTYWIEPYGAKFKLLADVVDKCRPLTGGQLLTCLYEFCLDGDPSVRKACYDLLARACTPLFDAVYAWISEGMLLDDHEEFFVAENGAVTWQVGSNGDEPRLDSWWFDKYSVRTHQVGTATIVSFYVYVGTK